MIKLFAILTVIAALPVSALAYEVPLAKNSAIHCGADANKNAFAQADSIEKDSKSADKAVIAN